MKNYDTKQRLFFLYNSLLFIGWIVLFDIYCNSITTQNNFYENVKIVIGNLLAAMPLPIYLYHVFKRFYHQKENLWGYLFLDLLFIVAFFFYFVFVVFLSFLMEPMGSISN